MCCMGRKGDSKKHIRGNNRFRLRLVTAPFELFRRLRQKKFGFGFGDEKFEPKRFPTQLLSKSSKDESSVGQKAERLRWNVRSPLLSLSLATHTHLHALTLATSHHTRTHTRSLSLESRVVSKNLRLMANRYNYTSAFPCCQPELGI